MQGGQDEGWRDPGEGEFAEELSRSAEAEKEAIAESPGEDADTRMRELNEIIRDPITASLNLAKNNFTTFQNELAEDYVANLSDNPELTRDIYMANEPTGVIRLVDYEGGTDEKGNFSSTVYWGVDEAEKGSWMGGEDLVPFMEAHPLVQLETSPMEYWEILTGFVKDPQPYLENVRLTANDTDQDQGTQDNFTERLAMLENFMALPQFKDAFDFSVDPDDKISCLLK